MAILETRALEKNFGGVFVARTAGVTLFELEGNG